MCITFLRRHRLWALCFVVLLGSHTLTRAEDTIPVQSVILRLMDFVEVPARKAGVLDAVSTREGADVEPGHLLAKLDDSDVTLAAQRAKYDLQIARIHEVDQTRLKLAERTMTVDEAMLSRVLNARKAFENSISETEIDRMQLARDKAVIEVEQARRELEIAGVTRLLKENDLAAVQRELENRRVVAPTKGLVVKVYRQPGEWVEVGEKLIRLLRIDTLRAEGFIPVAEAERVRAGAVVMLKIPLGQETLSAAGTVTFVSPEVDPVNGQLRIWAEVDNSSRRLRPGVRAEMVVAVDPAKRAAGGVGIKAGG